MISFISFVVNFNPDACKVNPKNSLNERWLSFWSTIVLIMLFIILKLSLRSVSSLVISCTDFPLKLILSSVILPLQKPVPEEGYFMHESTFLLHLFKVWISLGIVWSLIGRKESLFVVYLKMCLYFSPITFYYLQIACHSQLFL